MLTNRTGQRIRFVALCCLPLLGPGPVTGQQKELTAEARKELEGEARRLNQEGVARYGKADYKGALRAFERAIGMYERLYPKRDHPDLAQSLYNLGAVLRKLGQAGKALPYFERALAMRERLHP